MRYTRGDLDCSYQKMDALPETLSPIEKKRRALLAEVTTHLQKQQDKNKPEKEPDRQILIDKIQVLQTCKDVLARCHLTDSAVIQNAILPRLRLLSDNASLIARERARNKSYNLNVHHISQLPMGDIV